MCVWVVTFKNRVFVPGINLFIFLSSLISEFQLSLSRLSCDRVCVVLVYVGTHTHTRGTGEYVPGPSVHVMRYKVCLGKMKKIV